MASPHARPTPLLAFAVLGAVLSMGLRARGDELTPGLESAELRERARQELKRLAPKVLGLYLAFDPSVTDPSAFAACDDDGDPVIVLSEAMLRLTGDVAHAAAIDDENGGHKLTDYAAFLSRSQRPGKRLLPPPAGFYEGTEANDDRLRDVLSFVIARELAHHAKGDLTCAHPTATRESGDDVWTNEERRASLATSAKVYPGKADERDADAIQRVTVAGRSRRGATALLRFGALLERASERASTGHTSSGLEPDAPWLPSYLTLHPKSAKRTEALEKALP